MLTFTLILEPLWSTMPSCQPGVKHLCTREKEVFFLSALKISLVHSLQGPFQVIFVGTQQQKKQETLDTRKRKGQDTTKITSAPAESCIQFPWSMYLCCLVLCPIVPVWSHWDVTSDHFSQVRDGSVWITIRDFLLPPDMLAMRTAGPNWNHRSCMDRLPNSM